MWLKYGVGDVGRLRIFPGRHLFVSLLSEWANGEKGQEHHFGHTGVTAGWAKREIPPSDNFNIQLGKGTGAIKELLRQYGK